MTRSWSVCDSVRNHVNDEEAWSSASARGLGVEVCVADVAVDLAMARGLGGPGRPVAAVVLSLTVEQWPDGAFSADAEAVARVAFSCAQACAELGVAVLGVAAPADAAGVDVTAGLALMASIVAPLLLALGPVPGTAVGTHAAAAEVAGRVGGAGVLLDAAAAWSVGEDPAELVARLGPQLALVRLGDAIARGGHQPFGAVHAPQRLLEALDASGYAGTATVDVTQVPGDPTAALQMALAATA